MEVNTDLELGSENSRCERLEALLQAGTEEACVVGKGRPASSASVSPS